MKPFFKRALAGVAVTAAVAGVIPLLTATPAAAAPPAAQSGATITPQTGLSGDSFTISLPAGAACKGDSSGTGANGSTDWRWQTYMVAGSINPSTLTFGSNGPTSPAFGAGFRQPLFDANGSSVKNQQTANASSAGGPGPILGVPPFKLAVFTPGQIPAGQYNVGIACTNATLDGSPTPLDKYWNVLMTVTTTAGGTGDPAAVRWNNGAVPAAPTTVVSGAPTNGTTGQVSVAITPDPAANPAISSCLVYISTAANQASPITGSPFTDTNCSSPFVKTGLTYGQAYFVRVSSVNTVGEGPQSTEGSATPVRPAVTNLTATPAPNSVTLSWTASPFIGTDTYNIAKCTLPATVPCDSTSAGYAGTTTSATNNPPAITGLNAGQLYTFTVTYGAPNTSLGADVQSTPLSNSILLQDVSVGRPNGALVLTQVCGKWDQMPLEGEQFGFPTGLPQSNASSNGTAPTYQGSADPNFPGYPYPTDPNSGASTAVYPTHCGIALGNAQFISKPGATGADGAGQFFAASGRLNQVTVVDTRDTDQGWAVNFAMSDLTNGTSQVSGNELGWSAQKTQTPGFTDGFGHPYAQAVAFGTQSMTPNSQGSAGAGTAHSVITAPAGSGLGIATLDARIKLLIPVNARNGNYTGTLTINAL